MLQFARRSSCCNLWSLNIALWPNFLECLAFNIYRVSFTNIIFPIPIMRTISIFRDRNAFIRSYRFIDIIRIGNKCVKKEILFLYSAYSFLDSVSMIIDPVMLGDKVHRINFTIGHDDYMLFVVASIASSSISSTCVRLFGIALMLVSMPCSLLTSKCSDALHSTFSAHSNVDFLGNFYYLFFPVFSRCRGTLIF